MERRKMNNLWKQRGKSIDLAYGGPPGNEVVIAIVVGGVGDDQQALNIDRLISANVHRLLNPKRKKRTVKDRSELMSCN